MTTKKKNGKHEEGPQPSPVDDVLAELLQRLSQRTVDAPANATAGLSIARTEVVKLREEHRQAQPGAEVGQALDESP